MAATTAVGAVREDLGVKGPAGGHGALAAEMVGTGALVALDALSAGSVPRPRDFVALFVLFEVLAIMTDVGPETGRVAAYLGGLVTFAVALYRLPGILRFTGWLTSGTPTAPAAAAKMPQAPPTYTSPTVNYIPRRRAAGRV